MTGAIVHAEVGVLAVLQRDVARLLAVAVRRRHKVVGAHAAVRRLHLAVGHVPAHRQRLARVRPAWVDVRVCKDRRNSIEKVIQLHMLLQFYWSGQTQLYGGGLHLAVMHIHAHGQRIAWVGQA